MKTLRISVRSIHPFLLLGIVLLSNSSATAYSGRELQKLFATDGFRTDNFGRWLAIDGGTALIGASGDNDRGTASGSAYIFTRGDDGMWTETQKLLANDGTSFDQFGVSVALSDDIAVIGANRDDPSGRFSGSAYVFTRDATGSWYQQAKLSASDGAPNTYFGGSVAVCGDSILVGSETGAVYFFRRGSGETWTEVQILVPTDGVPFDGFGYSLAMDGETALIGAPRTADNNPGPGSAYVFTRVGNGVWIQQAKILDGNGQTRDRFGWSVAVHGDTAVIGAYGPYVEDSWLGTAHVFTSDATGNWTQQATLVPSDGNVNTSFGWSVAVHRDTAVVGARTAGDRGIFSGAVYVFTRSAGGSWAERAKLLASDGEEFEYLGSSVASDRGGALAGAILGDGVGPATGAAYYYLLPVQVGIDIKPDSFPNSVNPGSRGVISVAILGGEDLDVAEIDETTLSFGSGGAPIAHRHAHFEDVNLDGILDLVTHYRTQATGIACGDESATLTGQFLDGQPIDGSDSINTVGCRESRRPAISMRGKDTHDMLRRDGPIDIERK